MISAKWQRERKYETASLQIKKEERQEGVDIQPCEPEKNMTCSRNTDKKE